MGESKRHSRPIPRGSRRRSVRLNVNTNTIVKPDLAELIKMRKLQGNKSGTKMIEGNFRTRRKIHHSRIENQIPDNVLTKFHAKGTSINHGLSMNQNKGPKNQNKGLSKNQNKGPSRKLDNSQSRAIFNNLRNKHIRSVIAPHSFVGINLNTGKIKKKRLSIKNKVTLRKGLINDLERQ